MRSPFRGDAGFGSIAGFGAQRRRRSEKLTEL